MLSVADVTRRVGGRLSLAILLCGLVLATTGDASAQAIPSGLTADQLMKLQDQMGGANGASGQVQTLPTLTPEQTVIKPTTAKTDTPQPVSRLEKILSDRAGTKLRLFGYDQFGNGSDIVLNQVGGMQDDYVLGQGDEIVVSLRGQENAEYRATVDRDGRVVLPRMNPVAAGGRSFGEFRRDLTAAIHRAYVSTEGYISLGRVRQINVLVSGEVNGAGVLTLNGLSTVADAVLAAGGIKKTGSLRNVKIVRGGKTITVDLYAVLMDESHGKLPTLTNGDRVVVPQIGASFGVGGEVRREAVFELPAGRQAVTLHEAMAIAGGTTVPGKYIVSLMKMRPDGSREFVDVTDKPGAVVRNGEILIVKSSVDIAYGQIWLDGAVRVPGTFSIDKFATLHDLIPSQESLEPGAYMLFGFIDRLNLKTMQHMLVPFSPLRVVQGQQNMPLQSEDHVYVMTVETMRSVLKAAQERQRNPNKPEDERGKKKKPASDENAQLSTKTAEPGASGMPAAGTQGAGAAAPGAAAAAQGEDASAANAVADTATGFGADMAISDYVSPNNTFFGKQLVDYTVSLIGAVHSSGSYLVAPGTTLAELLVAANGLSEAVDLSSYELTSTVVDNETGMETTTRNYYAATKEELTGRVLLPKDVVVFHASYSNRQDGAVEVTGEVRYPGLYSILRNERLSDLLRRAGGLSENAYPFGAVFLRKSLQPIEREANLRTADQVQTQLVQAMTRLGKDNQISGETFSVLQGYIEKLRSQPALGRMVVIADPAKLATDPSLDPLLEPGDSLFVPTKPFTVSVMGEVLRQASVPYRPNMTPADYIDEAGGFTQMANDDEIFVVLPDGTAYRARSSWYDFMSGDVPVGSTIYVGREIVTYDSRQLVLDITTIFSQFATTAAAMAVLITNVKTNTSD